MQCLLVLLCWFDLFPATMDMDNRRYKLQMSVIYPLLVFRHVRNSYKGNVICFSVLILWKRKCCHVQSPDVLCPLKLHEKQSVVVLKVSSCFFFFFARFFVCISMSLIHPFHCLEFHQPGLTCLYTQWHTVSKVSPHTIFLRFSRQDCHCWFVTVEQGTHITVMYLHCFVSHSPSLARLSAL